MSEPLADDEFVQVMVCVTHKRFVPCRSCAAMGPNDGLSSWSSEPIDVAAVRAYQLGNEATT